MKRKAFRTKCCRRKYYSNENFANFNNQCYFCGEKWKGFEIITEELGS